MRAAAFDLILVIATVLFSILLAATAQGEARRTPLRADVPAGGRAAHEAAKNRHLRTTAAQRREPAPTPAAEADPLLANPEAETFERPAVLPRRRAVPRLDPIPSPDEESPAADGPRPEEATAPRRETPPRGVRVDPRRAPIREREVDILERIAELEASLPQGLGGGAVPEPEPQSISPIKRITEIVPSYRPPSPGHLPESQARPDGEYVPREFAPATYHWAATNLHHRPAYFEDIALERYGHTYHPLIQPAVSIGKFGAQLLTLPYAMTIDPPGKKMYTLGYDQMGNQMAKREYRAPWNFKAASVQGAVTTGFWFLIP